MDLWMWPGLTASLPDSSPVIRRMALRGLGALGNCNPHHLETFAPVVLNALMNGLEEDGRDKQESNSGTANEALEGLMAVIPVAPLAEVERLASRLALRVRPFFEHEEAKVRHAAVSLLASLFLAGSKTSARAHLAEQVRSASSFSDSFWDSLVILKLSLKILDDLKRWSLILDAQFHNFFSTYRIYCNSGYLLCLNVSILNNSQDQILILL